MSVVALGCSVLAGWVFDSDSLRAVRAGHVTMKANAACSFVAAGIALWVFLRSADPFSKRSKAARFSVAALAVFVLAVGVSALTEYLFGVNLRVDELLFRDPKTAVFPGRIAAITAVCFCLTAASLLLRLGGRRARRAAMVLALLLGTTAFAAIVGYAYGVTVLYGEMRNSAMAFHTGIGFLLLSVGLVLAQPESAAVQVFTAPERGGWLARRVLAFTLLVPVALGWVYLMPAMNFGQVRFALALFAVTLAVTSTLLLWFLALSLNRMERQHREFSEALRQGAQRSAQSESELRLLTDRLPVLLSYLDLDGRFLRVNGTYTHWLGLDPSEIVGRTIGSVLGESYAASSEPARAAALGGKDSTLETTYRTVRGERHARVTYTPDLDEKGQVCGLVCMVQDIEDQRRAELALRQSEKLAAVGRLAASIAHEINNPLESVTNLVYLAHHSETLGEVRGYLDTAEQELRRVSVISRQTLRFYKQSTNPRPVLCADLFEGVLSVYQGRIVNSHLCVQKRNRATTPILCFENEIRQVLSNLVGNAIDAMRPGGGRLLLRSRPATQGPTGRHGVLLTVADTGTGMSAAVLAKVFEPFFTTKGMNGTGLGLWVSSEIMERHGGRFKVRSRQKEGGSGTVFQLFLPSEAASRS